MDIEKQEQAQTAAPQSQQIQRNEVGAKRHPLKRLPVKPQVLVAAVVILAVIAVAVVLRTTGREKPQPQVLNTSYNNNYGLRRGSQPRLFPSQSRSC